MAEIAEVEMGLHYSTIQTDCFNFVLFRILTAVISHTDTSTNDYIHHFLCGYFFGERSHYLYSIVVPPLFELFLS